VTTSPRSSKTRLSGTPDIVVAGADNRVILAANVEAILAIA
jgi:hypothetical protein